MKKLLFTSLLVLSVVLARGQFEYERVSTSFSNPDRNNTANHMPESLCLDPRDSSLVIVGRFSHVNDSLSGGIIKYKNGQVQYHHYDSLSSRYRYVHYYKDAIYLGSYGYGLARLDSTGFTILENRVSAFMSFYTYNDTLILGGKFDTVAGIPAQGLIGYDGTQFISIHGFDTIFGGKSKTILAISEYNGNLVVGGIFGTPDDGRANVMMFDGKHWVAMGQGLGYATFGSVRCLTAHGNYLYAGGVLHVPGGPQPNDGIARWNGRYWEDLGNPFTGVFHNIDFIGDTLIASGDIRKSTNPTDSLRALAMYYDGEWMLNDKLIGYKPYDIEAFEGDYYMVGSSFGLIYSDTPGTNYERQNLIRLTDWTFTPNVITSVHSTATPLHISLYPNPVRDELHFSVGSTLRVQRLIIHDVLGRKVYQEKDMDKNIHNLHIPIAHLLPGIYFVTVHTADETYSAKFEKL